MEVIYNHINKLKDALIYNDNDILLYNRWYYASFVIRDDVIQFAFKLIEDSREYYNDVNTLQLIRSYADGMDDKIYAEKYLSFLKDNKYEFIYVNLFELNIKYNVYIENHGKISFMIMKKYDDNNNKIKIDYNENEINILDKLCKKNHIIRTYLYSKYYVIKIY